MAAAAAALPATRPSAPSGARAATATVLRLPVRSAGGLVDGLLRGRAWVAFVGALLVGIVFLNVTLLKVNGEIAYLTERSDEVRRDNAGLRLDVARLAASERIQRLAAEQGMVMPAAGDVTYLEPEPEADVMAAVDALAAARRDRSAGEPAVPGPGEVATIDTEPTAPPAPRAELPVEPVPPPPAPTPQLPETAQPPDPAAQAPAVP